MSRTYRKTPSCSEASKRKKLCKKIANREVRRAIKNGVEMANGSEYKYHVKDRWDYSDYCMSYRAQSLASWIDMHYKYYVSEIHSYETDMWYYENAKRVDVSNKTIEYYESEFEKFDYDCAYEDWSANSSELKKKYRDVYHYFNKRQLEIKKILRKIRFSKRMLENKPVYPVWDRKKVEQEYKKYYVYK